MGTPAFAVPSLQALHKEHEVVGVVTQPDKPRGRSKKPVFSEVKTAALALNLPVYQPRRLKDAGMSGTLAALKPDVIVVAAFGQILPRDILTLPPHGCINVHASLLPRYRGAAPINRCIMDGETETGVTIMQMDEGLDTGDILATAAIYLDDKETATTLTDKLALVGAEILLPVLAAAEAGTLTPEPQDDEKHTYAKMLKKSDGFIRFDEPAERIEALIRAVDIWPNATCLLDDRQFKIFAADVVDGHPEARPGTVIAVTRRSMTVQCGEGALALREVQLAGKKRMPVASFLAGNPITVGMHLTEIDRHE